jgi:hypothetical protein
MCGDCQRLLRGSNGESKIERGCLVDLQRGICRNWLTLKIDRPPEIWHTTGTPERSYSQQNRGFRLTDSQSTLIHQTAIGGTELIKST